jgi:hypothetical protein
VADFDFSTQQQAGFGQLPAQAATTADQDTTATITAEDKARLAQVEGQIQGRIGAESGELAADQAQLPEIEARKGLLDRDIAAREKEAADYAASPPQLEADKMRWRPPRIDEHQLTTFGMMIMAMGLIGGVASRGNWAGVTSSLTGALQGMVNGEQENAERAWKLYETQFKEAVEHDKTVNARFERVLKAKDMSINAMIREYSNLATQYDRAAERVASHERNLDQMYSTVQSNARAVAQIQAHHERNAVSLRAAIASPGGRAYTEAKWGPGAQWLMAGDMSGGNGRIFQMLHSRFTTPEAVQLVEDMAQYMQANGISANAIGDARLSYNATQSVLRVVENRRAGVQRLTDSIQQIEEAITRLTQKINGQGIPMANATWQWLGVHMASDPDVIALRTLMWTVATQYTEATTMPNSNAQLHATVQKDMVERFNSAYNLSQVRALFQAVNADIGQVKTALDSSVKETYANQAAHTFSIPYAFFTQGHDGRSQAQERQIQDDVISRIPGKNYVEEPPAGFAPLSGGPPARTPTAPAAPTAATPKAAGPKGKAESSGEAAALKYLN